MSGLSKVSAAVAKRARVIKHLKLSSNPSHPQYDVLVIGGGCSGAGAALDAVTRGLRVACVEKGDFATGTSSRSTKLIWGGSRYLVQALVTFFSPKSLRNPKKAIVDFVADFKMVLNCHKERKFLLETQSHLTNWLPIAVPMKNWIQWPPPFNYPLAALGPLGIYPLFFKFYDSLSRFTCPPSHVMTRSRSWRKFPQLANNDIKYSCVFYEGQHDDARTNLAITLTAEREGCDILNYCEVIDFIFSDQLSQGESSNKAVGVIVRDSLTKETFSIYSKSILLCGGPYTDNIRFLAHTPSFPAGSTIKTIAAASTTKEANTCDGGGASNITEFQRAVTGASGTHIVLPSYLAPSGIGLVDMNTSDNRFLFYLPWEGHVLVGTTDKKLDDIVNPPSVISTTTSATRAVTISDVISPKATSFINRPVPSEQEICWLLREASKYLSPELQLRREDVLSAWAGVRPLASNPHNTQHRARTGATAVASRDHVVSHDPETGIVFVAGGKWTTYREMAQDAVDKVVDVHKLSHASSCRTLQLELIGKQGHSKLLPIRLIQEYRISSSVADRLSRAYGGRAHEVLAIAMELASSKPNLMESNTSLDVLLSPGYPYIEAEVIFAIRFEHAIHAEDILARRTRLAFLNKTAAARAIPRIVHLMAAELDWDETRKTEEMTRCNQYLTSFGGPTPIEGVEGIGLSDSPDGDTNQRFSHVQGSGTLFG